MKGFIYENEDGDFKNFSFFPYETEYRDPFPITLPDTEEDVYMLQYWFNRSPIECLEIDEKVYTIWEEAKAEADRRNEKENTHWYIWDVEKVIK